MRALAVVLTLLLTFVSFGAVLAQETQPNPPGGGTPAPLAPAPSAPDGRGGGMNTTLVLILALVVLIAVIAVAASGGGSSTTVVKDD